MWTRVDRYHRSSEYSVSTVTKFTSPCHCHDLRPPFSTAAVIDKKSFIIPPPGKRKVDNRLNRDSWQRTSDQLTAIKSTNISVQSRLYTHQEKHYERNWNGEDFVEFITKPQNLLCWFLLGLENPGFFIGLYTHLKRSTIIVIAKYLNFWE